MDRGVARRPGGAPTQVIAAGVVGLIMPFGGYLSLVAGVAGGQAAMVLAAAVSALAGIALLTGVATMTPGVSRLPPGRTGRICWAVLVSWPWVLGWGLSWAVAADAAPGPGLPWPIWNALLCALTAGVLLRRWHLAVGSLVLAVAACYGLLSAPANGIPEMSEADRRLADARRQRADLVVSQLPGYHRSPEHPGWVLRPDGPAGTPPGRHIRLRALPEDPIPDCVTGAQYHVYPVDGCTVERTGLAYWHSVSEHGYVLRRGGTLVELIGSTAVDRALLRDSVLAAVATADPASHTVDIPGYTSAPAGPGQGLVFQLTDRSQWPGARDIEVDAPLDWSQGECAAQTGSQSPSPYLECLEEGPGLHYRRLADRQVYVHVRDGLRARVAGSAGADRAALRAAVLAARVATDEEILTLLPPAAPQRLTVLDRVRRFAKRIVG
ncbi:hypothetical protein [Crossiella cryophila]|uniref:Uncharacterized protein n=1 Tax=Crossiella cryophila TaxID=43355 RepID=A0A7W7CEC9_9PSEU|nr:hypothetical protein [Crossiella cryophila]MBB4679632.1 hypothetical protein [Crossiella cryophila]